MASRIGRRCYGVRDFLNSFHTKRRSSGFLLIDSSDDADTFAMTGDCEVITITLLLSTSSYRPNLMTIGDGCEVGATAVFVVGCVAGAEDTVAVIRGESS